MVNTDNIDWDSDSLDEIREELVRRFTAQFGTLPRRAAEGLAQDAEEFAEGEIIAFIERDHA